MASHYPTFTPTYSGEEFDRAQSLADAMTEEDRRAGRPAPAYGYSKARFDEAKRIVREAHAFYRCGGR